MKTWGTSIFAKHNITGEMAEFCGENIQAPTRELAIQWCQIHAGYLHVNDEIIMEIPCKPNSLDPDWDKAEDYDLQQQN